MQSYIPYQLRTQVSQIDPRLDFAWQNNLINIFKTISPQEQEHVYKQILQPKSIIWNAEERNFVYLSKGNFNTVYEKITHPGMKTLAAKILSSFEHLKKYQDAYQIADYIESILTQVDTIDVEDNLELQKLKLEIRKEFIYTCAEIITTLDIKAPDNVRKLNSNIIKAFILEVYLKQQLLGYWFKTLRPHQLKSKDHSILHGFLFEQQKIRQLEVVQTSKYIFALAPTRDAHINPFSIRRFLNEESLAVSGQTYLNGAFLDLEKLENSEDNSAFEWQISRIISIEKQIKQQIIDLIDIFEAQNNKLLDFLFTPLDSSGLMIEKVIQHRLWDFEHKLTLNILEPLADALKNLVTHKDECDYLYISVKQIFGSTVSYFKDFQAQPAIMFDKHANMFSGRLNAYVSLLEKRQFDIFALLTNEDWNKNHEKMQEPTSLLRDISKDALKNYKDTYLEIKTKQRLLDNQNDSFWGKLFNKPQKIEEKITQLKQSAYDIRQNTYIEIVKIPKTYQSMTAYLEFEALISINNKERHYAFPMGDNGVTRLPILVQLPEDRNFFNIQELYNNLDFDLSLANQKWDEATERPQ